MTKIHQLLSGFACGDAISTEAVCIRDLCRGLGMESEIFVERARTAPDMAAESVDLAGFDGRACDVVIFHYSISSPAEERFLASSARKILVYHNITPAEFFDPFDSAIAAQLRGARARLVEMAQKSDEVWTVSEFNAVELREAGIRNVKVFPLIFNAACVDTGGYTVSKDLTNILFVGRMAPNKCVEDLITAFAWYHYGINRRSRLFLVGSDRTCPSYFTMLQLYARELDLSNVCFQRFVAPNQLPAFYKSADLYVCTSRHEGYCLPLVEAMNAGVPVIARNAGGMPEAMGGAGILYDDLKAEEMAVLFHKVIRDPPLRSMVLESQSKRMSSLRARVVKDEFMQLMGLAR